MMSKLWTKSEMMFNGGIRLSLYRSTRSKLQIAVGDVPGPMVNGNISFATEANTDDGLPHTLEHLVFMGSKKYPFKGVLDIIANRCMADGTNAWTDQDHTAYTLSTAGSEGFFKVLPVYINHLLCPIISDSQFATEVHHINGEGLNAGVVYSEMQDHESEMENILDMKMKEVMYAPGHPYGVDAYGRLKNLRDSCNVNKVREYHKKYYHLSNMMVTVCGRVDHSRLLEIMEKVEQEYLADIPADFARPFAFTVPPLAESSVHRVVCPSDDETRGIVDMNWFGPEPTDMLTAAALQVLFDYMSNTPVSPLQKDFVLLVEPLASSASFSISEQVRSALHLHFGGVPTEKLDEIKKKFCEKTLKEHLDEKAWDMERMSFLIEQIIQNELVTLETSAHSELAGHIIGHHLFGENAESLAERVDQVSLLRKLKSEPASYWSQLLDKYFSKNSVTVIGVPSEKMVEQIANEEKARLEAQQAKLGAEGMKKSGEAIAAAITENTANKPSSEVLDEFIVKNLEDFDRFPMLAKSNNGADKLSEKEELFLKQFPFPATVHNCPTKFVELFLLLDSHTLSADQRAWLYLYNELLFESAAMVNGERKTADEVAKLYTKDLIDHSVEVGVSGQYDKFVDLRLKVNGDTGFPNLAKWVDVFTRGIIFEVDKVKMCAQKLVSEAREKKRDGCSVAATAINCLTYQQNSNTHMYDSLVLEKIHEKAAALCDKDPKAVIDKLEEMRSVLLSGGVNVHILCDIDHIDSKLYDGQNLWKFANETFGKAEPFKVASAESVDGSCIGRQKVISVGGSESSFIYQTALIDSDWTGPGFVPTLLFTQYLSQTEGPLWRGVRGDGLAYGANIYVKGDKKCVTLSLYRCAQPSKAYEATKKIVMDVVNSGKVDESEFEAAKRSLIFEMMQKEQSVSATGKMSIIGSLRGTPPTHNRDICQRIWDTSIEDMLKEGGPRVANLFENFVRAIAVHPQKVAEIKKSFSGIEAAPVTSFHFDASNGGCRKELRRMMKNIPCLGGEAKKVKT